MGFKEIVKSALIAERNRRYLSDLQSRKCSYHAWIMGQEAGYRRARAGGASMAAGAPEDEWFLAFNPDGRFAKHALVWIAEVFREHPDALLVYGDEDVWPKGKERTCPLFKPDWSPDLFLQEYYLGGLVAIRRDRLKALSPELYRRWELVDCGESTKEDCQQVVADTLRLAGGFEKNGRALICHLPRILFHSNSVESQKDFLCYDKPLDDSSATEMCVSVIIPSKDHPELLKNCVEQVVACADGIPYELIVVDNGSDPENKEEITKILEGLPKEEIGGPFKTSYCYKEETFNFSLMCNRGAREASGDLLLFLNDDVTLLQKDTLPQMACLAARKMTGAVGIKLLYPPENEVQRGRIQHAGITNLPMGPVHKLQFCKDGEAAYWHRNSGRHNLLAVTAACLMVERSKFEEIGGFTEELAVAFNDVDLCFALHEAGYSNVCDCDLYAYHNESFSRGDDESAEKLNRLLGERARLYERHPLLEGKDPFYSVFLNRDCLDTRIRPEYETGKRIRQRVERPSEWKDGWNLSAEGKKAREDACLLVRVESFLRRDGDCYLTGYSVVLGDNNACYEKALLLQSEDHFYALPLVPQYRPDLEENMPDQCNVALCGFWLEWPEEQVASGAYRVGVMAKNQVGNTCLINWSNRMVEL